jgi:hypothetical protein
MMAGERSSIWRAAFRYEAARERPRRAERSRGSKRRVLGELTDNQVFSTLAQRFDPERLESQGGVNTPDLILDLRS